MSDGPVLLWVWRHFRLYAEERESLSEAAGMAQAMSENDTGSAAGAEAGGKWYDSDALSDIWWAEWREYERQPKPPEPTPVATVTIDPPQQVEGNEVDGWVFHDLAEAEATYDRLHAAYGDRVHLVRL